MKFPCTKCGLCCRKTDALRAAGMPVKLDGSCMYLGTDNLCIAYAGRPNICRVDFHARFWPGGEREYYQKTAAVCNKWIKESGLGKEFEVIIP